LLFATGAAVPPAFGGPLTGLTAVTFGDVHTETWSIFGDFTVELIDSFKVSLGGRYTSDTRRSTIIGRQQLGTSAQFGGSPIVFLTTTNFQGSRNFNKFTPRASIAWNPTAAYNLYASYSKGFKGGGFDPRGRGNIAPDTNRDGVRSYEEIVDFLSFEPETVDSYEIGLKASLFDRRLRFNLAGFYADYKFLCRL